MLNIRDSTIGNRPEPGDPPMPELWRELRFRDRLFHRDASSSASSGASFANGLAARPAASSRSDLNAR
jgi:hypothetical protein